LSFISFISHLAAALTVDRVGKEGITGEKEKFTEGKGGSKGG